MSFGAQIKEFPKQDPGAEKEEGELVNAPERKQKGWRDARGADGVSKSKQWVMMTDPREDARRRRAGHLSHNLIIRRKFGRVK